MVRDRKQLRANARPLIAEPIARPISEDKPTEWVINSDGQSAWIVDMLVPCVDQFGDYL